MDTVTRDTMTARRYAEAVGKVRAYDALARRYAADGDAFLAVHAAWAADVSAVQAVLWQQVLSASERAEQGYAAVVDVIREALGAYAAATPAEIADAASAVQAARQGLAAAFDPALGAFIAAELPALDYLVGLPVPAPDAGRRLAAAVLGGNGFGEQVARQRFAAIDGITVALGLAGAGLESDALRQAWLADWATLEAYLLEAAVRVGDADLVTVAMRWALACAEVAQIRLLPVRFADAVTLVRAHMARALGEVEGARLMQRFMPLATPVA